MNRSRSPSFESGEVRYSSFFVATKISKDLNRESKKFTSYPAASKPRLPLYKKLSLINKQTRIVLSRIINSSCRFILCYCGINKHIVQTIEVNQNI